MVQTMVTYPKYFVKLIICVFHALEYSHSRYHLQEYTADTPKIMATKNVMLT